MYGIVIHKLVESDFIDLIGEKSICLDEAIDIMNTLNDENEQLKQELKELKGDVE